MQNQKLVQKMLFVSKNSKLFVSSKSWCKKMLFVSKNSKLFNTNLYRAAPPGADGELLGRSIYIYICIRPCFFYFSTTTVHLYQKQNTIYSPAAPRPKMAPNLTPLCPRPGTAHRSRPNGMSVEYRENNVLDSNEHSKNR